jgi:hypothetical protein
VIGGGGLSKKKLSEILDISRQNTPSSPTLQQYLRKGRELVNIKTSQNRVASTEQEQVASVTFANMPTNDAFQS